MNILRINHGFGFFSDSTVTLASIIEYYNKYRQLPNIDRSKIYVNYKETEQATEFFEYEIKDAATGDAFVFTRYSDLIWNTEIVIDESKPQIVASPLYLDIWGKEILSFCKFKDILFENIKDIIKIYFSPSHKIFNIKKELENKYNINLEKTIGVYYRGTDKRLEGELPPYDIYFSKLKDLLYINPDYKIILQSDEKEFLDYGRELFPAAIIFSEDTIKGNKNSELLWYKNKDVNINQTFFAIVMILSQCKEIIVNTSNVSLWISLYRGYSEGIHQYLENNPKINNVIDYCVDNPFYDPERNNWV